MLKRHVVPPFLAVVLCSLVVALWACTPARPQPAAPQLNGAALEPPVALPALTFARSDGGQFISSDTRGRISLFFFGYTHCPDVCPLTLAQLVRVRQTLGSAADQVDMYFVTLDPARDTAERMRTYVANFPGVTGLIGTNDELAAAQATFNVLAERRDLGNGDYALDHTAAMYLVNRQSEIMLAYPYGTDPNDVVADLRHLVDTTATSASLDITQAWARPADVGGTTAVYLHVDNSGGPADRLIGVASPIGNAQMHQTSANGGMVRMSPVESVDVPANAGVSFEPGGLHIMIADLRDTLSAGDALPLTLSFEQAGTREVQVPVK